jgi:hypothetical protein
MSSISSPEVITRIRHDMNFVEGLIVQDGGTCLSPVEISLRYQRQLDMGKFLVSTRYTAYYLLIHNTIRHGTKFLWYVTSIRKFRLAGTRCEYMAVGFESISFYMISVDNSSGISGLSLRCFNGPRLWAGLGPGRWSDQTLNNWAEHEQCPLWHGIFSVTINVLSCRFKAADQHPFR